MIGRLATLFVTGALLAPLLGAGGCSRKPGAGSAGAGGDVGNSGKFGNFGNFGNFGQNAAAGRVPGDPDCYQTTGAIACPPEPSDPSGQKLPTPGAVCALSECGVCGSSRAPAFRDAAGIARPGWCICVTKSDSSGAKIYSCFGLDEWQKR